jgi:hypothetical protein
LVRPLHAEWLPGPSRALSLADSASPDAPVTGYAYGPRAQVSLGGDWALLGARGRGSDVRLGGTALLVFEDAERRSLVPTQTLRTVFELSAAWAFPGHAAGARASTRTFELALVLGRTAGESLAGYVLSDRHHADDVPFGAGGTYLGADAAFRAPLLPALTVTSRLCLRLFTNAFPDLVGQPEASDLVADSGHEGAEVASHFELALRWAASAGARPLLALYADSILPHDDSAKVLWLGRALLGVALPGRAFELTPFLGVEAGHGQGVLVNRTELRLGSGLRLNAR